MDFSDPSLWVAVAFLLFMAFFIWKAVPGMIKGLDNRAAGIKSKLEEAREIREDAERTLAEYQRKHAQAMSDVEKIMDNARGEAAAIKRKAEADLESLLDRRERSASEKIAQAEATATQEVRSQAVALAMAATQQLMAGKVTAKDDGNLIKDAIDQIPTALQ